ncbi:MAG: CdaR family protein [Anaerolineales bacterium]|nr:CdaR family protein [Anaerolineales bacterium]
MKIMRWLGSNLTSLILSLLLALVVWISAVISANPNTEVEISVPLEVRQLVTDLAIVDQLPGTVSLIILAPESIIHQLEEENPLIAYIELPDIQAGTYRFQVRVDIPDQLKPIRVLELNPKQLVLKVSNLISKVLPISIQTEGEPAIGYQTSGLSWEGTSVTVTGQENKVQDVIMVVGTLDISDATNSINSSIKLEARTGTGEIVDGIMLSPETVIVNQVISLQGGYRNVAVNVITMGVVEPGYRFTSITPAPPTVMVFSEDPQLVKGLPGYVNTKPLNLTGVNSYLETILELDLPEGVTVVGDPTVLIQVNVTTLETNMVINREIEVIGLLPGFTAEVSPSRVSVQVSGPVPVLENLTLRDIRVVVDLAGLAPGTHTLTPTIEILPVDVIWEDLSPATVEVVIREGTSPSQ